MNKRVLMWGGLGVVALSLAGFGGWIFSLPPTPVTSAATPIAHQETEATLAALKPPKHPRPVIAIIGINDATEVTDYLMPYGILKRADIAEVAALATQPGPVALYPALRVEPDGTIAEFDARHPDGADYVIVPAMSRDDDPAALKWIKEQAAKGAIVIGVCAGAKVVAETGLLDGRQATTHWYYLKEMRSRHPTIRYVADRRFVAESGVATTTGITASMPMSLTLIEAIAGRPKAEQIASDLALAAWDARHNSGAFKFTRSFALTALGNVLAFWNREKFGLELRPGMDEVALALVADAWSRTYRSSAVTFAADADAKPTRNGLRVLPDRVATSWPLSEQLAAAVDLPPAEALQQTLSAIEKLYGASTANFVAMQLEYPR